MRLVDIERYWTWRKDSLSNEGRDVVLFQDQHLDWLDDCQEILDAGCGAGHLVRTLRGQGKAVEGITYNPSEVELARSGFGTTITLGDLHDLPYPDGEFDAVVCWDALEHTVAPYHVLCEFRRVLKPQGKLLIFMPGDNWLETNYHVLCLTIPQMVHLYRIAGYSGVVVHDYGQIPQHGHPNMAVYRVTA